ncbi:purple acid phosphatase family protein [Sphingobacterium sp. SGR-19]|uniref:purple acid phosphatase family protein n=1 Tax=Sphingobacterium sp. SGR-19 TaxID=2710886 RepID=UPI0013EA07BE|nr:metallophosphoesterase family protein [Sphingobacterium sp. SGR-19]NGM67045.1 metallophosphoesterase family protein [Sphingobacterium sp. SGR-19]
MHRLFFVIFLFSMGTVGYAQPHEKQLPPDQPFIPYKASEMPDRILMSITDSLAQTRTITWRTSKVVQTGTLEWSDKITQIDFYRDANRVNARSERFVTYTGDTVYYHTATLRMLKSGENYVYRVGEGDMWSEWIDFSMPTDEDAFQFIYMGDAQNDIRPLWSRVFRKAYAAAPAADFVIHVGDLINHSQNEYEWAEWFRAGDFMLAAKPQLAVRGNHEYVKDEKGVKQYSTPSWPHQFRYPPNGPSSLSNGAYFIDIKNCRFVFMDSNDALDLQGQWLEQVLKYNTKKWAIVVCHHPVVSATEGRINDGVMTRWKPLFDKYNVDLVLQGHDHVYARGRIPDSEGNRIGPTYVISVAGRKAYAVGNHPWMEVKMGNVQTYQLVEMSDEAIVFKTYALDGHVLDVFRIVKRDDKPVVEDN